MAFPYGRVKDIEDIVAVVKKEHIEKIILGVPVLWRGGQAPQMKVVEQFAARLRKTLQLPMEFENEMFTSKIAEQTSRRDKADAAAAALILQSHLDKRVI